MTVTWVRIRSWHAVRLTRSPFPRTLCGRLAAQDAEVRDTLPAQRSCETCLRIVARVADQ